jgi:murein L,D-transpeptidase YafK
MSQQRDFLSYQLTFLRVQLAKEQSDTSLRILFQERTINYPAEKIYIRAFKQEQLLEIWVDSGIEYKLIKIYRFTANSGNSGPKKQEGDLQIPEGFYQLTNFNAESKFHLSMKINYPNEADNIRNQNQQHIGGNIYIHGGNQTTGCIPIGDENIAELYWLCAQTYAVTPSILIHIFPCKMEESNLTEMYNKHPEYIDFWNSMKPVYQHFQIHKSLAAAISCDDFGNYIPVFS